MEAQNEIKDQLKTLNISELTTGQIQALKLLSWAMDNDQTGIYKVINDMANEIDKEIRERQRDI